MHLNSPDILKRTFLREIPKLCGQHSPVGDMDLRSLNMIRVQSFGPENLCANVRCPYVPGPYVQCFDGICPDICGIEFGDPAEPIYPEVIAIQIVGFYFCAGNVIRPGIPES